MRASKSGAEENVDIFNGLIKNFIYKKAVYDGDKD